jgi:hypothetical protein
MNGWTNYATWKVNLEAFDGLTLEDLGFESIPDQYVLADTLRSYAEGLVDLENISSLARDWAKAFLSDVDYAQIAQNMLEGV